MNARQWKAALQSGGLDAALAPLYPGAVRRGAERLCGLIDIFTETYGDGELLLFSSPGRTEIGGNHTDHQRGCVLAGAVNLDIIAVARASDAPRIRVASPGHGAVDLCIDDLSPAAAETGRSASLVRGMAAGIQARGLPVRGFDVCTRSDVHSGSGLSSSAAFEALIGVILREMGGGELDNAEIAKIAQQAENHWFGKPCGLMDQMACAVGGLVAIDFADPAQPLLRRVDFDFAASGHALCITGPIGSHAGLNGAYAAVPAEMGAVARLLGKHYLREVDPQVFYDAIPTLLGKCPDRAILRAIHFFGDNERARTEADALARGDFAGFLRLVRQSGRSSYLYLQNVLNGAEQRLGIALAESERVLDGAGAVRVHGGGFAGTIQAFVPHELSAEYVRAMNRLFGENACRLLAIRSVGATAVGGGIDH